MLLNMSRKVTTNIVDSKKFSVTENSSKLFAMLSNMLYKEKERSVLTELASNAIDAHKLVCKNNIPIKIVLPTLYELEIKVRDYGPGLSEEDIHKYLTTYGESSKQNNNDFIGGYGIGSKSPAAVTETWTIHSYYGGLHKQYLIYISNDGIPSLTKVFEKSTNETGLEVVIPVKRESIYLWNEAAKNAFRFYKTKPEIHNGEEEEDITFKFNSDILAIPIKYEVGLVALINDRVYTIDTSKLELDDFSKKLTRNDLILKFKTGDLNLSLSREDLQYNKNTIDKINENLIIAIKELKCAILENVKKVDNELEFIIETSAFMRGLFRRNIQEIYETLCGGEKYYSTCNIFSGDITIKTNGPVNLKCKKSNSSVVSTFKEGAFIMSCMYNEPYDLSLLDKFEIKFSLLNIKKYVFVKREKVSAINKRVIQSLKEYDVFIADDFSFLPDFLKSQIINASDLPAPELAERTVKQKIESNYYRIVKHHFEKVDLTHFDKTKTSYIFFKKANSITSILPEYDKFINILKELMIPVIYIKEGTEIPSFALHPTQILLNEYNELLKNYDALTKMKFIEENKNKLKFIKLEETKHSSVWNKYLKIIKDDTYINSNNIFNEIKLIEKLSFILNEPLRENIYEKLEKEFLTTYPIIEVLFVTNRYLYLTEAQSDVIMQYVEMVKL